METGVKCDKTWQKHGQKTDRSSMCKNNNRDTGTPLPSRQTIVQPKLELTTPGDSYEREADRMADFVMRRQYTGIPTEMPSAASVVHPTISRSVSGSVGVAVDTATEGGINASRGGGQPMPEALRSQMESGFGTDFSGVRLHTDSRSADLSQGIQAKAFTYGNDIYFNRGQYSPDTAAGQHLIAHELTHVVQQSGKVGREPGDIYLFHTDNSIISNLICEKMYSKKDDSKCFSHVAIEDTKGNLFSATASGVGTKKKGDAIKGRNGVILRLRDSSSLDLEKMQEFIDTERSFPKNMYLLGGVCSSNVIKALHSGGIKIDFSKENRLLCSIPHPTCLFDSSDFVVVSNFHGEKLQKDKYSITSSTPYSGIESKKEDTEFISRLILFRDTIYTSKAFREVYLFEQTMMKSKYQFNKLINTLKNFELSKAIQTASEKHQLTQAGQGANRAISGLTKGINIGTWVFSVVMDISRAVEKKNSSNTEFIYYTIRALTTIADCPVAPWPATIKLLISTFNVASGLGDIYASIDNDIIHPYRRAEEVGNFYGGPESIGGKIGFLAASVPIIGDAGEWIGKGLGAMYVNILEN